MLPINTKGETTVDTDAQRRLATRMGATRRDFLRAGAVGLGSLGFGLTDIDAFARVERRHDRSVILLLLVGGPSQLETWDPKPDAPAEVRGPYRSIATRCPGVRISEHLPRMATRMDRLALIRSVHHDSAPIHETGYQLLQTGRLCRAGERYPNIGSVVAWHGGAKNGLPVSVILPRPIANTGVDIARGQSAGCLGSDHDPFQLNADPSAPGFSAAAALLCAGAFVNRSMSHSGFVQTTAATRELLACGAARNPFDVAQENDKVRDEYGRTSFGQSCLLARRLVEAGVRFVTVNMYDTVFNRAGWDCHGASPFSTLSDYANSVLPTFDLTFSALLDDLDRRGRLESTLVIAAGEFGRTPRINASGGRDHWPGVWSVVLAGGGVRGGQVLGASDEYAAAPVDRPVTPQDLAATLYFSLGIGKNDYIIYGPDGESLQLVEDGAPIQELFA
jgi:uncharacterized protein (DUF1501 family)